MQQSQAASVRVTSAVDALRRKFIDGLDDRLLQFEAVLADMRQGRDKRQGLREIAALCHKIAGIAPSFGFERIGQQARQIEMAIDRHVATMAPDLLLGKVVPVLETFLDRLEALIDVD